MFLNRRRNIFIVLVAVLIALSVMFYTCSTNQNYTPHPKGYFRIALPEKKYAMYAGDDCPFRFELPAYAVVKNYHDSVAEPCWKYIRFPQFNSEIFLSYKKVNGNIDVLIEDSRTLAYKHTVKAESIDETVLHKPGKGYGIIYDIGGNAASSVQFFITDSTQNFIRGALYFNVEPQPDSLAPVIEFLRQDVERMMESVVWK